MNSLDGLRLLKHKAFRAKQRCKRTLMNVTEPAFRAWRIRHPYVYDPTDFSGMFVQHDEPLVRFATESVPRVIYVFWTGPNAMSCDRQAGLRVLEEVSEVKVELVTPETLAGYLVPEAPLHPAYEHLHYVHRADYLRCYFMHFHGGGYADIKPHLNSWQGPFDRIDDSDAWLIGYRNPVRWMTPNFDDKRLQKLMVRTSPVRIGQTAFIFRPQTPFTSEWWRRLNEILDLRQSDLAADPGSTHRPQDSYPLAWTEILAQIIDPLAVKYSNHILYDARLHFDTERPYL